jgi:4'-phosphopantetheinyl transferase EntD
LETFSIASLVPPTAAVAEIVGSCAAALLPDEEDALGSVSDKRRLDFTFGRECARQALRKLGIGVMPILRGAAREPLWPPGVCGSITHCEGYCAAVVAFQSEIRGIGIDAERLRPLQNSVLERVALETERLWIQGADSRVPWEVLLFSAKESVFKAWFPAVGTWLGFEHARIEFHPATQGFQAIVLSGAPGAHGAAPMELTGRFHVDGERVLTSAFIPAVLPQSRPSGLG